jgi:hypothetical protein
MDGKHCRISMAALSTIFLSTTTVGSIIKRKCLVRASGNTVNILILFKLNKARKVLLRLCDNGYANAALCYVIGNSSVLFAVYLTCVLHSVCSCGDAIGYSYYVFRPTRIFAAI